MKAIIAMLTGVMLMLIGIFLLLIGADGFALLFAVLGVVAFLLGVIEGLYGFKKLSDVGSPYVQIAQRVCPECGEKHDVDYPRCPYCGHRYEEEDR